MVNTNLKNIFRIAFITCLCISISSCKDSFEDFFDESTSIDLTSSISGRETGNLVSGGSAVLSFTLPEENAATFSKVVYEYSKPGTTTTYTLDEKSISLEEQGYTCTVKNIEYKGYRVNLATDNLSFSEYDKLDSSAITFIKSYENFNMKILEAGTYKVVFRCSSSDVSDYSVQLKAMTDLSFYEGGGKVFDKINITKISEDSTDKFGAKTYAGSIYSGNIEPIGSITGGTYSSFRRKKLYINLSGSEMATKEFNITEYNSSDGKLKDTKKKEYYPLSYINGALYITKYSSDSASSVVCNCQTFKFDTKGYSSEKYSWNKNKYYKTLASYNGTWDGLETSSTTTELSFINDSSSSALNKSFEITLENTGEYQESYRIQFIQYLDDDYIKNGGKKISVSITDRPKYDVMTYTNF